MAEGELQRALGRNLRRYRDQRGLSQEAFADFLGYHRTYVGGLERGERNLSLRSVERIAQQLGLNPLELLGARSTRPTGSEGP
ncbi:helix-turn-helix domain-containing protein [Nocardioides kongjuensis]|uniref:Transcriptional regulator with XRE-family HTH domain n=1 Tax=Nocardioides kongjuensis TaxID=349522 RepID=A0A852RGU3_9ACTN|nr:helix-turn-helix transcriptional regulator [Nocardioides kongjuensis]NYD32781.1 transcriptional regulator with XRE-family HTH domain [Nocardioides kongjuensis]